MNYIKQICEGTQEDWVHNLFIRYSKGQFNGPQVTVDVKKKNIAVKSSYELSGLLAKIAMKKSTGQYQIDGGIFSKTDFREQLTENGIDFDDKSKKAKKYYVAKFTKIESSAEKIYESIKDAGDAIILLTLKPLEGQTCKVASGKKPPKPGKEEVNDKFVKAVLNLESLEELNKELFFGKDITNAKIAKSIVKYDITDMEIPEGIPADQQRLMAKRIGKLIRTTIVDEHEEEKSFELNV